MPTPHKREQTDDGPYTSPERCLSGTVGTVEAGG